MPHHNTIQQTSDAMGELFIWTDVDPAHEQDFNRWYDLEHMQERAAVVPAALCLLLFYILFLMMMTRLSIHTYKYVQNTIYFSSMYYTKYTIL